MSDHLQSGYHPDADQISAFVEHALPAHEHVQMLDHLASCEECRAVVAMSLPEIEEPEPARPLPAATRKSWWSGWTLTWSLAGALAAVVLSVVILRHTVIPPNIQAPNQIAVSHPPEMPAPQIQQPVSEKPQGTINATTAANRSIDRLSSANALAKPPIVEPLHIQGRNLAPLNQKTDAMSNGVVSSPAAPEAVSQSSTASEPQPPTAELKAPALQATETVQVAADSHVEQVLHNPTGANFSLDEAQIAQFIRVKHPLPSGLPVLSIAAQALRIVAIDTHNAVFLSQDGGKHWKAIQAPWSGRAVLASRIESPNLNRQTYNQIQARASGAMLAGAASPELKKQDQPSAAATCCRLAGTVTDATGAAIAGASVSVTNSASQAAQTIKTDSVGHYLIDGLAPGTYKLDAQAAGFMKQEIAAVSVADSRPNIADLSLNIASAAQTVTVEANSNEVLLDKKKNPKPKPSPIFEIVTDNGDHWTSTDGLTWKHM